MMTMNSAPVKVETDQDAIAHLKNARELIINEIDKIIVGQRQIIDDLLIALFSRGHCLIVGVPGLAKTLLISTISKVLDLKFQRIQFTPDLMPSDITGTDIIQENQETGKREFVFFEGPVFGNIILADEINRTPPKTQAALLEAMQEYRVTTSGKTFELPLPFFVLATQNPIEQEGTYPLPEAQLDRFMFNLYLDYPKADEEVNVVKLTTSAYEAELKQVLTAEQIIQLQDLVRKVPASDYVVEYAVRLVRATRPNQDDSFDYVNEMIKWGAGPRASQNLILGAKARAILRGEYAVSCSDIKAVAHAVLRHRIIPTFHAEAEGIDSMQLIERLLSDVPEGK